MKKITGAILAAIFLAVSPAVADDATVDKGVDNGTMGFSPSGEWAKKLGDGEMAEMRGGFRGISFSAALHVFIENLNGDLVGTSSTSGSNPVQTGQTTTNIQNGQVSISTYVGGFDNFNGVGSFITVPGSFNIVNSILNVNVALVTVANGSRTPSMQQLFGGL